MSKGKRKAKIQGQDDKSHLISSKESRKQNKKGRSKQKKSKKKGGKK